MSGLECVQSKGFVQERLKSDILCYNESVGILDLVSTIIDHDLPLLVDTAFNQIFKHVFFYESVKGKGAIVVSLELL